VECTEIRSANSACASRQRTLSSDVCRDDSSCCGDVKTCRWAKAEYGCDLRAMRLLQKVILNFQRGPRVRWRGEAAKTGVDVDG
jgi:hypothetical protein